MSLIAICLSLSFRLLQNQTARTSSFLLQGKMLWCFRRRHRKVSHLGSFSCPLLSFLFSPLVPLTDPTPSPFHLCPLCPFIFILSYPAITFPMIYPCISLSHRFLCVSLHLLAMLFQVDHCLLPECLKCIPPTLRSSASELLSNLPFHWQFHNVLRSHSAIHWMKKDARTLKTHCSLVPHHCHTISLNLVI